MLLLFHIFFFHFLDCWSGRRAYKIWIHIQICVRFFFLYILVTCYVNFGYRLCVVVIDGGVRRRWRWNKDEWSWTLPRALSPLSDYMRKKWPNAISILSLLIISDTIHAFGGTQKTHTQKMKCKLRLNDLYWDQKGNSVCVTWFWCSTEIGAVCCVC